MRRWGELQELKKIVREEIERRIVKQQVQAVIFASEFRAYEGQASSVEVRSSGTTIGVRPALNFIPGSGTSLSLIDNDTTASIDITISATGAGAPTDATYVLVQTDSRLPNSRTHASLTGAELHDPKAHGLDSGFHTGTLPESKVSFDTGAGHHHDGLDSRLVSHSSLLGLGNDDHTQYLLANGNRAWTGNHNAGNFKLTNLGAPVNAQDAANKQYVDDLVNSINTGAAAGNNYELQYNNSGYLGGCAETKWDNAGKTLTIGTFPTDTTSFRLRLRRMLDNNTTLQSKYFILHSEQELYFTGTAFQDATFHNLSLSTIVNTGTTTNIATLGGVYCSIDTRGANTGTTVFGFQAKLDYASGTILTGVGFISEMNTYSATVKNSIGFIAKPNPGEKGVAFWDQGSNSTYHIGLLIGSSVPSITQHYAIYVDTGWKSKMGPLEVSGSFSATGDNITLGSTDYSVTILGRTKIDNSLKIKTQSIGTTPYNVGDNELMLLHTYNGNVSVYLPTSTGQGRLLIFKGSTNTSYSMTIYAQTGDLIDNQSSWNVPAYGCLVLVDASYGRWSIVSSY